MKMPLILPSVLLLTMFFVSLWSSSFLTNEITQWDEELQQADTLAKAELWDDAESALRQSHSDWTDRQLFLHVMLQHNAIDAAESMYRRAISFAGDRNLPEFRAELADLRRQLQLLATQERLRLGNIF